jgi:hypothetical protein
MYMQIFVITIRKPSVSATIRCKWMTKLLSCLVNDVLQLGFGWLCMVCVSIILYFTPFRCVETGSCELINELWYCRARQDTLLISKLQGQSMFKVWFVFRGVQYATAQ